MKTEKILQSVTERDIELRKEIDKTASPLSLVPREILFNLVGLIRTHMVLTGKSCKEVTDLIFRFIQNDANSYVSSLSKKNDNIDRIRERLLNVGN